MTVARRSGRALITCLALFALVVPMRLLAADASLEDVLDADRAFAQYARERGTHAAFERYLADDAVLFRPTPVSGHEWLAAHEPATGTLEWTPDRALVACDGRLAVTVGNWTYTGPRGDVGTGQYLTAWRRDEAGWRVVLDQAITLREAPFDGSKSAAEPCAAGRSDGLLASAERKRNKVRHFDGLPASLESHATLTAETTGTISSSGADVALSYGELVEPAHSRDAARVVRAIYVRVWRRQAGAWVTVLEAFTPVLP